jgi:DNA-binding transcriptional LysR family regulator
MLVDRSFGARVVDAVVDNQADFGIVQLPVTEKRLQVAKIHTDEIKAIMPPSHPLASKGIITPADLIDVPLLVPKAGVTRSRLNAWLEPVDESVNISMELDATEMIKRFAMADLGIGFVAGAHCQEEVDAGKLAARSLGPEPMERVIGLIYRKDKALSKAALGFIEVTLAYAAAGAVPAKRAGTERSTPRAVPIES